MERAALIKEQERVVTTVVGKLLRHGQKSYIEKDDLVQVGMAEMIRTVDRPAKPGAIPLDKRVARNVKTIVLRFIQSQVREYTYAQEARGKAARDADAKKQGVVSPEGDSNDHDAKIANAATFREGAKVQGLRKADSEHIDRDRPSTRARALWRETVIGRHPVALAPIAQAITVAEAELIDWLAWRERYWADIEQLTAEWRESIEDAPIGQRPWWDVGSNVPATVEAPRSPILSKALAEKDEMSFLPWLLGHRYTIREIRVHNGRRADYGSAFLPVQGGRADYMRPVLTCVCDARTAAPAPPAASPERRRATAWLFRGNRRKKNSSSLSIYG